MNYLKLLIILCISCNAFSQDYKFGKVSKAELEETYNPADSSASATFLYKYRKYSLDFGDPSMTNLIIKVPEGFKVESVPSKVAIQLPENLGSFTYNVNATETNVQLAVEYSINVSVIHSDYYDVLKEFFKQLVIKEKEKVVLVKI